MSDLGVDTSVRIIENLRDRVKKEKIEDSEKVKTALREEMIKILERQSSDMLLETKPSVILVVGVNGVGKTTSIGKIANRLKQNGKKVVVAAADTFRAAAVEQLEVWCERSKTEIVKKPEGADPASVVYDAIVWSFQVSNCLFMLLKYLMPIHFPDPGSPSTGFFPPSIKYFPSFL